MPLTQSLQGRVVPITAQTARTGERSHWRLWTRPLAVRILSLTSSQLAGRVTMRAIVIALCLVFIAACGDDPPPADTAPTPDQPADAQRDQPAPPVDQPEDVSDAPADLPDAPAEDAPADEPPPACEQPEDECKVAARVEGACVERDAPDNTRCAGNAGLCTAGQCLPDPACHCRDDDGPCCRSCQFVAPTVVCQTGWVVAQCGAPLVDQVRISERPGEILCTGRSAACERQPDDSNYQTDRAIGRNCGHPNVATCTPGEGVNYQGCGVRQ